MICFFIASVAWTSSSSTGNLLVWQCTPSKPGWHLQMYSLKTSPRRVGATTSHTPSFLQGFGLQGPEKGDKGEEWVDSQGHEPSPSATSYPSRSGCRCLQRSRRHRCRWMDRRRLPSHTFPHCGRDSPHSSRLVWAQWKRVESKWWQIKTTGRA